MAWKPKLPPVGIEVVPMNRRTWVAVAESHAEQAVNLFVNIMKNPRISYKMRMEAATRIVMIAGATFRGERKDGNGRPAANLPSGTNVTQRLGHAALREALKQLPPGSVIESPEELAEGETAVVLMDGEHQRKPTNMLQQTTQASLVIGEADPEEAHRLVQERLAREEGEETAKLAQKSMEKRVSLDPQIVMKKLFQFKAKNTQVVEVVDLRTGKKDAHGVIGQKEAEPLSPRGDASGDTSGSSETG